MLDNVFRAVAKKHNIPQEQVELIYKNWIDTMRFYITNLFVSKGTIRLFKLGSFYITNRSAKTVENAEDYIQQFKRNERQKNK